MLSAAAILLLLLGGLVLVGTVALAASEAVEVPVVVFLVLIALATLFVVAGVLVLMRRRTGQVLGLVAASLAAVYFGAIVIPAAVTTGADTKWAIPVGAVGALGLLMNVLIIVFLAVERRVFRRIERA